MDALINVSRFSIYEQYHRIQRQPRNPVVFSVICNIHSVNYGTLHGVFISYINNRSASDGRLQYWRQKGDIVIYVYSRTCLST